MPSDRVMHLGAVQKAVARQLQPVLSINPRSLAQKLGVGGSIDAGYYGAALIRLQERGIASQVDETWNYVRGPLWHEAANFYGWKDSPELMERHDANSG